jgi:nicotinate-nucleotide adenylyltransferase
MRLGVLGGTFDPLHNTHLAMATQVGTLLRCDQLLLMPAYSPPHKERQKIASAYHRYAMAVLATLDCQNLQVSRLELEAPSQPYTVQTISRLQQCYPTAQLLFIMGADSFAELHLWREYRKLLSICQIVVVTRPQYPVQVAEREATLQVTVADLRGQCQPLDILPSAPVILTDVLKDTISATYVRQLLAQGQDIRNLVPLRVAHYIDKYQLYRSEHHDEPNDRN